MTGYEAKEIIDLTTVRGHLEGYADMLALDIGVPRIKLMEALVEDAAEIERIASELRKRVPLDS